MCSSYYITNQRAKQLAISASDPNGRFVTSMAVRPLGLLRLFAVRASYYTFRPLGLLKFVKFCYLKSIRRAKLLRSTISYDYDLGI